MIFYISSQLFINCSTGGQYSSCMRRSNQVQRNRKSLDWGKESHNGLSFCALWRMSTTLLASSALHGTQGEQHLGNWLGGTTSQEAMRR